MRVVLFFVYVCFIFLSGDAYAHANHSFFDNDSSTHQIPPTQQANFTGKNDGSQVTSNSSHVKEKKFLIADDVEDDEDDNCVAGKQKLPARSHHSTNCFSLRAAYATSVNYPRAYFKNPPYFLGYVAPKYIMLGVMRI